MPFHQSKKLSDLIWLRFAADFLQIQQFRYFGMGENVMASANSGKAKSKSLSESDQVTEADIVKRSLRYCSRAAPSVSRPASLTASFR